MISMPAKGFGGIDEPLHLLHLLVLGQRRGLELAVDPASAASSMPAKAGAGAEHQRQRRWPASSSFSRLGDVIVFLPLSCWRCTGRLLRPSPESIFGDRLSDPAEHRRRVEQRQGRAPTTGPGRRAPSQARWMKAAPSREMNSRSPRVVGDAEDADARRSPADRHASTVMTSEQSGDRRRRSTPVCQVQAIQAKIHGALPITPSPGRSPWRCSCGRTRSRARPGRWSARRRPRAGPNPCRRPRPCGSSWRRSAWR